MGARRLRRTREAETLSRELHTRADAVVFIDQAVWPIAFGALAQVYCDGARFRIDAPWAIVFAHRVTTSTTGPGVKITGTNADPRLVAVP